MLPRGSNEWGSSQFNSLHLLSPFRSLTHRCNETGRMMKHLERTRPSASTTTCNFFFSLAHSFQKLQKLKNFSATKLIIFFSHRRFESSWKDRPTFNSCFSSSLEIATIEQNQFCSFKSGLETNNPLVIDRSGAQRGAEQQPTTTFFLGLGARVG